MNAATAVSGSPPLPANVKDDPRGVERIRARYAWVNGAIEARRAQVSYLAADMARYAEGPWLAVVTKKECWPATPPNQSVERFPTGCAEVWRLDGKVIRTRVETTSPSGDWLTAAEYTFWNDGRLAFRFAQHWPFTCGIPGEHDGAQPLDGCGEDRRDYLDERGILVRTLRERWVRRGKSRMLMPEVSFPGPDLELEYRRLADFPFGKQVE